MEIRRMSLAELNMVLGWADQEGWNPGIDDASAFYAADNEGFFLGLVDGEPAAAISVVNHSPEHAFLGLYICRPMYRGMGYGFGLWQEALNHAGTRSVGLDGVPDQQANYARSGFARAGRTIRYRGQFSSSNDYSRPVTSSDLTDLLASDARAVGFARPRFSKSWFDVTSARVTLRLAENETFATFRRCKDGVKIGPFHAGTKSNAISLLGATPMSLGEGPIFVDVPDGSSLQALLEELDFEPVFETARMFRGDAPAPAPPEYYGVATLELG